MSRRRPLSSRMVLWLAAGAACLAVPSATLAARANAAATAETATAETAPAETGPANAGLLAERTRLRVELETVNAQIDALKRAGGGVASDYRLRARLADAESLAKRLIEIEARLGIRAATAPSGVKPAPIPTAAPVDGPAELDAKADILADQSRRYRTQADMLARRAREMKRRQELRRRAGDLDRDPFAAMEGSKRRIASSSSTGVGARSDGPVSTPRPTVGGNSTFGGNGPIPQVVTPVPTDVGSTPSPSGPVLSVQLRDELDATTLADIRRFEGTGTPGGSAQALERAAQALTARADWLEARARAMRAQARAR